MLHTTHAKYPSISPLKAFHIEAAVVFWKHTVVGHEHLNITTFIGLWLTVSHGAAKVVMKFTVMLNKYNQKCNYTIK